MTELDRLIYVFSKLPGLGLRSARRIVLHLLEDPDIRMRGLLDCMNYTLENAKICDCGNIDISHVCKVCGDIGRDIQTIAIVETISDLWAIERSGIFRGTYHVLGGTLSAKLDLTPEKLRLNLLAQKIVKLNITEVIIATNTTVEGQTTAFFIMDYLKYLNCKISRLASGMPIGGEIDYLDEGTLATAIKLRQSV